MKVLLTGGSGFIAAHILRTLLHRNRSVITTVRSRQKGNAILSAYPSHSLDTLDYIVVEDIAKTGVFDDAVRAAAFDAVIHTASPYHFHAKDNKTELLEPAINGTTNILKAVKAFGSSKDWCPITEEQALANPGDGCRSSKTFAEHAAWQFMRDEKPNFTLTVLNPPLVLGPVIHDLPSLASLNTSNTRILHLLTGTMTPTGSHLFVDVRDLAYAHVLAAEDSHSTAAGQRYFIVADRYSNREIVEIAREEFPEFRGKVPSSEEIKVGDYPGGDRERTFGFDSSKVRKELGLEFRGLPILSKV